VGTLALIRFAEPDAPSSVATRNAKRDPARAATSSGPGARPVGGPDTDTPVTASATEPSTAEATPETDEKTVDPRLFAASATYKAELYDKAIKAAEPLVKSHPLEARWIIGMSACKQQNVALSDKVLRELSDLGRADAASSIAEIKIACQHQRDLRKLNLRNPFGISSTAEQYYSAKLYKQARSAAEETVQKEPVKSWDVIGRASCALKDPTTASAALSHLEENPMAPQATLTALKATCDSFGYALRDGRFRHK
jgi:predicted Zn-dependent protease